MSQTKPVPCALSRAESAAQLDHARGHLATAIEAHSLAMRWLSRAERTLYLPNLRAAQDRGMSLAQLAEDHLKQAIEAGANGARDLYIRWKIEGFANFRDDGEMIAALETAAAAGHNDARYRLAARLLQQDDAKAAVALLKQAASEGHAGAICRLGRCYQQGEGVGQDRRKALQYLTQAADLGRSDGSLELGRMHLDSGNPREAARHFEEAVELGNREAMFELAGLLEAGAGRRRDEVAARRLMLAAARAGHPQAAFEVGNYHMTGRRGFKRDSERAARWYRLAARGASSPVGGFSLFERGAMKEGEERWELRECPPLPQVDEARRILRAMIDRDEVRPEAGDGKLFEIR